MENEIYQEDMEETIKRVKKLRQRYNRSKSKRIDKKLIEEYLKQSDRRLKNA